MQSNYLCFNGEFWSAEEKLLTIRNRAFRYGDGLFETIRCLGTQALFFDDHWDRLSHSMKFLKMEFNELTTKETILRYIERLLNKNRIFKGARIRLSVFRNDGGLYTPTDNEVSWVLESSALDSEKYELNTKGLYVDVFDGVHKPINALSGMKTANALIFILAGCYRKETGLDDCFILNQYGRITENLSSNVYLFREDKIITPPLSEGCIAGTMRHKIPGLAVRAGYHFEEKPILEKYLLDAEEVFITNAIQGIQWIGAYKEKRYFNFVSRKLISQLNDLIG